MPRNLLAALLVFCLLPSVAAAQPPPPADPKAIAEAKEHFDRGLALSGQHAWDAALAEFLRSRQLAPRPASTVNAANCLKELHRYDEALDLYEETTTNFPDVEPQMRAFAQRNAQELRAYVGQIVVTGAEGAAVVVDSRPRDASSAMRVSAGTHVVRASKPGSAPFETRVEVAGQERVTVAVTFLPVGQTTIVKVVHDAAPEDSYHPLAFELVGGLALAPSVGGDVSKNGSQGLGVGPLVQLHADFQTRFGLALGLTGGYTLLASSVTGGAATLEPVGEAPEKAKAADSRQLRVAILGAAVAWRFGEVVPVTVRLNGGALVGSFLDRRTASVGGTQVPPQLASLGATHGFVAPEVRVGYRFAGHFEASAGAEAMILFGSAPVWDPAKVGQVNVPGRGLASYSKETLANGTLFAIVPTLGVRYDL